MQKGVLKGRKVQAGAKGLDYWYNHPMETYGRHSNPMMRRPIVKEEVLNLMRTRQRQLEGGLANLQKFAKNHNIPIIPQETIIYFQFFLPLLHPKKILEVGTAIGFSSLLFSDICPEAEITTIDRHEEVLTEARKNLADHPEIHLLEGEAADILPRLTDSFDFIFMDSAKTQYVKFLPLLLPLLSRDGVLIIDDIFQGGDVALPLEDIPRRQRNIHKGLNRLFDATLKETRLVSSLLPLGDGLLLIRQG